MKNFVRGMREAGDPSRVPIRIPSPRRTMISDLIETGDHHILEKLERALERVDAP